MANIIICCKMYYGHKTVQIWKLAHEYVKPLILKVSSKMRRKSNGWALRGCVNTGNESQISVCGSQKTAKLLIKPQLHRSIIIWPKF